VLVEDWRIEDNTLRPHSALGYIIPTNYAGTVDRRRARDSHSGWTNNLGPVRAAWRRRSNDAAVPWS